ncbi:hypothetical protein SAY86_006881 [Trapa natans]|uniref:Uncharacterized protein n=1 Tax=Trapa natans TaxID=22666 RepID=A0AAN7KZN1_TRANT|nr:hypothetical protein SAY86_006881 [Trapa natans]
MENLWINIKLNHTLTFNYEVKERLEKIPDDCSFGLDKETLLWVMRERMGYETVWTFDLNMKLAGDDRTREIYACVNSLNTC